MPCKANPQIQRDFLNDTLMPLIEKANNGLIELFFLDASHFVMGGFPGRVWSIVRKWVKTACGRQRFNVLGALNFVTKKVETIVNTTYITSTEIVAMLEKLTETYVGKPIMIVLDNARYQRCKIVFEAAERLGVELVYLPTYSPNLNLIERVWKLVKSRVLNSSYHETFQIFCDTIENCIDSLHSILATEMNTLISHKFRIVNESDIIC
jgi:transposase